MPASMGHAAPLLFQPILGFLLRTHAEHNLRGRTMNVPLFNRLSHGLDEFFGARNHVYPVSRWKRWRSEECYSSESGLIPASVLARTSRPFCKRNGSGQIHSPHVHLDRVIDDFVSHEHR